MATTSTLRTCYAPAQAILSRGGAEKSNVFTRILLALYGVSPLAAVPVMPVEIMLLPKWFPFHIDEGVLLGAHGDGAAFRAGGVEAAARNTRGVTIDELFLRPPKTVGSGRRRRIRTWSWFLVLPRHRQSAAGALSRCFQTRMRRRAIEKAVAFVNERLNGEDGLGAIFPAMANSVMMFDALGYPRSDPDRAIARQSDREAARRNATTRPTASPASRRSGIPRSPPRLLEAGGEAARGSVIERAANG